MDPLITICARSGSQGVKDKNIRPLLGRPLIAHSIDSALRWGRADRVVVSTDSEEIARVARVMGPKRHRSDRRAWPEETFPRWQWCGTRFTRSSRAPTSVTRWS